MSVFIVVYLAKKNAIEKQGAVHLATAVEASNAKMATAKAVLKLEEELPESSECYFAPKVCADRPGLPRPQLDVLDEAFMLTHIWNDGTKEPEAIPGIDCDENFHDEEDLTDAPVDFWGLTSSMRCAVLVRHHTDEILRSQLPSALELEHDESSFDSHLLETLIKTPGVSAMYPDIILQLIDDLRANFDAGDTWPQMKAFAEAWMADRHKPRQDDQAIEPTRTDTGAVAGGGTLTDRGADFLHSFDTLRTEIALGLHARTENFDIYQLSSAQINQAREIIKTKEKPFPAWERALLATPGILDYSRAIIIYTIKTAPDDVHRLRGALQTWINKTLTETNHAHPDAKIVAIACGEPPAANSSDAVLTENDVTAEVDAHSPGNCEKPYLNECAKVEKPVLSNNEQDYQDEPGNNFTALRGATGTIEIFAENGDSLYILPAGIPDNLIHTIVRIVSAREKLALRIGEESGAENVKRSLRILIGAAKDVCHA